jgi:hypothetical protein
MMLTTSPPSCAECHGNLGALTSWNPLGHTGPVTGLLYLYLYIKWDLTILFTICNFFLPVISYLGELPF